MKLCKASQRAIAAPLLALTVVVGTGLASEPIDREIWLPTEISGVELHMSRAELAHARGEAVQPMLHDEEDGAPSLFGERLFAENGEHRVIYGFGNENDALDMVALRIERPVDQIEAALAAQLRAAATHYGEPAALFAMTSERQEAVAVEWAPVRGGMLRLSYHPAPYVDPKRGYGTGAAWVSDSFASDLDRHSRLETPTRFDLDAEAQKVASVIAGASPAGLVRPSGTSPQQLRREARERERVEAQGRSLLGLTAGEIFPRGFEGLSLGIEPSALKALRGDRAKAKPHDPDRPADLFIERISERDPERKVHYSFYGRDSDRWLGRVSFIDDWSGKVLYRKVEQRFDEAVDAFGPPDDYYVERYEFGRELRERFVVSWKLEEATYLTIAVPPPETLQRQGYYWLPTMFHGPQDGAYGNRERTRHGETFDFEKLRSRFSARN